MNWNSVDQLLLKVPKPLLRMLSALLIWIGITFTPVSSLGIMIVGFSWLKHLPRLANLHQSLGSALLQNVSMLVLGVVFLTLGYRAGKLTGLAGMGSKVEAGARKRERKDCWRAIFHLLPDDRLSDWVIHFNCSPEDLKRRLAQEQKLPKAPTVLIPFLVDGTKPMVRVNGRSVSLATDVAEVQMSAWQGLISTDASGKAVLQGRLRGTPISWYFAGLHWMARFWMGVFGLVIIAVSLFNGWSGLANLLYLLLLLPFGFFDEAMSRVLRWKSRRHERQIESFFKGHLYAQSIYLTPRPETFSKEWFKNFRKNR